MSTQTTDSAKKPASNLFNRQLGMYSLAAAVASVSMLALAEPASGEVVITKKTIHIPIHPYLMPDPTKISMANDGVDNCQRSSTKQFRYVMPRASGLWVAPKALKRSQASIEADAGEHEAEMERVSEIPYRRK